MSERDLDIDDAHYHVTSMNERPGVAPTSSWVFLEHPDAGEGRGFLALVGLTEVIVDFLERAGETERARVMKETRGLPVVSLLVLGSWPVARAKKVLELFTEPGSGCKQWGRIYRRQKLSADPDRREAMPSTELARHIVSVYAQECRRMLAMGDA